MPTDWSLVRAVMAAAIDACEAAERLELRPEDRGLRTASGSSVWDVLTSAWTFPESVRYTVIRTRHDLHDDAPYVPELGRPLVAVAAVCAELVGAIQLDAVPEASARRPLLTVRQQVEGLAAWYREQMAPQLRYAAETRTAG